MASIIKANQLQDFGGNSIIGSDGAGNLTTQKINYPAFEAYGSSQQTGLSDDAWTKVTFNTKLFDTDNMYDNSTNYRFTPTVAGKYFVYTAFSIFSETLYKLDVSNSAIYKNGSTYKYSPNNFGASGNEHFENYTPVSAVVEMNGSTDYVEAYGRGSIASGTFAIDPRITIGIFGAYRIGS